MTKEEIIKQGRPSEPYCFETDAEETWYNIGLYDGATAEEEVPKIFWRDAKMQPLKEKPEGGEQ